MTVDVTGYIDACDDGTLLGWGARPGDPAPVTIEVLCDGAVLGTTIARMYREDLKAAGIGDGRRLALRRAVRAEPGPICARSARAAVRNAAGNSLYRARGPRALRAGGARSAGSSRPLTCAGEEMEIGAAPAMPSTTARARH